MEAVRTARRLHSRCLALALVAALTAAFAVARPTPAFAVPTEYMVKAALVFNIMRFVEWPATSFPTADTPLVLAIMGQDEVSDALRALRGQTVNGHPLEVRRVLTVEDARKCHVLYVAGSETRRANDIIKALRGASTLTVADIQHFAERGGQINMVFEDQRVRVFVNPASAEESRLKISAKLLSLAQIVGEVP